MHLVKSLAVALSMYSKIPVPAVEWKEENMKYAMCFFPVVGVAVGILQYLAAAVLLGLTDCGAVLFSAVMTLIPVLVTGGIHLDGFADTTDAIASWGSKEKKLEILKDPHTGAFAVIGLCCWFLFTFALWSEVPGSGNSRNTLAAAACLAVLAAGISVLPRMYAPTPLPTPSGPLLSPAWAVQPKPAALARFFTPLIWGRRDTHVY